MKVIYASGKHSDRQILVSDCDYELLSKTKWYIVAGYACGHINKKLVKMHRIILNAMPGEISDHIDRDRLNNQRENLRKVTHAENVHNREYGRKNRKRNFTGVENAGSKKSFRAIIQRGGKAIWSETFTTELAAAIRYNRMLIENNFDGVPNPIPFSQQQQEEILKRDLLKPKRSEFQSGIRGITFCKSSKTWLYRKTINGKRIFIGSNTNHSEIIKIYNNSNHLTGELGIGI